MQAVLTAASSRRAPARATSYRAVLDRLETTLAPREPALAELARELRWRACDGPLIEAAREETAYAAMERHRSPPSTAGEERDERIGARRLPAAARR